MSEKATSADGSRRVDAIVLTISSAVVLGVLASVIDNELVWDDIYFVEPLLRLSAEGGLSLLWSHMTTPFWESSSFVTHDLPAYWRPVTMLLLGIGGMIFGDFVAGYHMLSLAAALGAAASFGLLVSRLQGSEHRTLALWLALIFLIHPLCAEVLCLVVNISDHLALCFINLQLVLLLDGLKDGSPRWTRWTMAGCAAFLACCSKEVGVICVFSPLLAWALHRKGRAPLWPWITTAIPVAVYFILRYLVLTEAGRDTSLLAQMSSSLVPLSLGFGQAFLSSLAPVPQGAHATLSPTSWWGWTIAAACWLILIIGFIRSIFLRRWPSLPLLGLVMALLFFLPSALGVTFTEGAWRFPIRYFHLPLAGFLIAGIPFLQKISSRLRLLAPVIIGLLALLSYIRIADWQDNRSFFEAEVEHQPRSPFALSNLAYVLCDQRAFDEAEAIADRYDALPRHRDRASDSRVDIVKAKIDFLRDGDLEAATTRLSRTLRDRPSDLTMLLTLTELWALGGHPEISLSLVEEALESPLFRDHRRGMLERYEERYRSRVRTHRSSESHDLDQDVI